MTKKHKIALSDDELRLIVDALQFSKQEDITSSSGLKNRHIVLSSIGDTYNPLIARLRKTLGKEN